MHMLMGTISQRGREVREGDTATEEGKGTGDRTGVDRAQSTRED